VLPELMQTGPKKKKKKKKEEIIYLPPNEIYWFKY
jgi:hypothetical protein